MARFDRDGMDAAGMIPVQAGGEAYYELGVMYASGRSAPVDLVAAHKWFNIAAVPILVSASGLTLAFYKRKRTAAK